MSHPKLAESFYNIAGILPGHLEGCLGQALDPLCHF